MTSARPVPGIGRDLTTEQSLAAALRILAHEGWQENLSGHITWADDDGGMWVNPWGLWWSELLVIVDGDLPRSSGGKVAKGELRAQAHDIAAHHIASSSSTSESAPPRGT